MKKFTTVIVGATLCIILISFSQFSQSSKEVPYPENYREWKHIKTAIIGPKSPAFEHFGGFHHIYANAKAVEGYKTNHFADGSIIVFDVLEAVEKNTDFSEGKRRIIDVMIKDTTLYPDTGGWGFEEFKENSKTERTVKTMAKQQCFNCHAAIKVNDFVFSKLSDN